MKVKIKCRICGVWVYRKWKHQTTCLSAKCKEENRQRTQINRRYWNRKAERCRVCEAWLPMNSGCRTVCSNPECKRINKRWTEQERYWRAKEKAA